MGLKKELDLRGICMPVCLLECKSVLVGMQSNDELEVLVNDPAVLEDLMKIIKRYQGRIATPRREGEHYRIRVGPTPVLPSS